MKVIFDKRLFFCMLILLTLNAFGQINNSEIINGTWRFIKEGNNLPIPNDSKWEKVKIPHTWNIVDGQSGGGTDEWQNDGYYRGPGTYTCRFNHRVEKGKRKYLRFEAVSQVAEVFLNGKRLGEHKGAFNAFIFDITDVVKNGENILVVNASNIWDKHIAPLGGDFTLYGGIYRPVWIVTKNEVAISPMNYASSGVYFKQTKLNDSVFNIEANTIIMNNTSKKHEVEVIISLYNKEGVKVVDSKNKELIVNKSSKSVAQNFTVLKPVLWQGTENPYLYKVQVQVYKSKQLVETHTELIGFRTFTIDPLKGAFLNGKPWKIRGVNRHQDRKGMGWAVSNEVHDEDMAMIKEIGANGLRLAHYPHCKYTHELADMYGFLVWAEIPLVNNITGSPEFAENAKLQLKELILQNYNHPSIVFWSIYNEMGHRKTDDPHKLLTELNELSHQLDPTRYTVAAPNHSKRPEKMIPDVIAFNSYPGWYGGKAEDMKKTLINWNNLVNNKGVGVSEYGAGGSIFHHQQGIETPPKHNGKWHPEQYQAFLHEVNYKHIKDTEWCWGSFVWNMFDFASAGRNEGDTVGVNNKGLVTYDRKIRKDAFYFYKANWNPEPMVYISSRRHVVRDSAITDVKVYSNCDEPILYVNDKKVCSVKGFNAVYQWRNIDLKVGKNKIRVVAKNNGKEIVDECVWELITK